MLVQVSAVTDLWYVQLRHVQGVFGSTRNAGGYSTGFLLFKVDDHTGKSVQRNATAECNAMR
jgi:hypothetical protein